MIIAYLNVVAILSLVRSVFKGKELKRDPMKKKKIKKQKKILPQEFSIFFKRIALRSLGGVLLLFSLALVLSFLFYNGQDGSFDTVTTVSSVHNILGSWGAFLADAFLQFLGLGSFIFVGVLLSWGWQFLKNTTVPHVLMRLIFLPIMLTLFCSALSMVAVTHSPDDFRWGGVIGDMVVSFFPHGLSLVAFFITASVLWFLFLVSFLFVMALSFQDWRLVFYFIAVFCYRASFLVYQILKRSIIWCIHMMKRWIYGPPRLSQVSYNASLIQKTRKENVPSHVSPSYMKEENNDHYVEEVTPSYVGDPFALEIPETQGAQDFTDKGASNASSRVSSSQAQATAIAFYDHEYERPTLDLFLSGEGLHYDYSHSDFQEQVESLQKVLGDFGIKGKIHQVHPGPVVILYEFEPAPGIKSSRIIGLVDDIARGMGALSVRIGIIPGQKVLGIEIPQEQRQMVRYRDVLENSMSYMESLKLPMILGLDIGGRPQVVDLAVMPHLLMAGTTGSGKSVGLNAMILSLLFMLSPQQCRFIMIDPKMLELSVYNDIPHLLTPVVTDPKKAVVALKWAVKEMEDRYQLMSKMSVRNIEGYNNKVVAMKQKGETFKRTIHTGFDEEGAPQYQEEEIELKPLPYIVVIIDEMADLMMVSGKEIEASVQRLAQMARAAGIHLITATQRPSVDVITGTIKANFVHRISFKVTSKIDSRTILGEMGAEQLLGRGDMLYLSGGGSLKRIHGPFVEDSEVESFCNELRSRYPVHYEMSVSKSLDKEEETQEDEDDLYEEAVALVMQEKRASTSFIQRYFKIGYNRAARLVESMERQGIVSEPDGAGRRHVLMED